MGPGPDNVGHIRELEIYWGGSGEPLKVFEQESNAVQDQFEKMTLAAVWGMDGKGELGGREPGKGHSIQKSYDEGLNWGTGRERRGGQT